VVGGGGRREGGRGRDGETDEEREGADSDRALTMHKRMRTSERTGAFWSHPRTLTHRNNVDSVDRSHFLVELKVALKILDVTVNGIRDVGWILYTETAITRGSKDILLRHWSSQKQGIQLAPE
jgi:hypothetical protein